MSSLVIYFVKSFHPMNANGVLREKSHQHKQELLSHKEKNPEVK